MIAFRNVVQSIGKGRNRRELLTETNFVFSPDRLGLAISSTEEAEIIMDLLCGVLRPEFGSIWRDGRPSWPIGRIGQYRANLTGKATLHFLASIYNLNFKKCEDLLFNIIDIGENYNKPLLNWPRNLLLEFGYLTTLMPDFEIYIVESSINTANETFNEDFNALFEERIKGKKLIYYSSNKQYLKKYVTQSAGLIDGHFYLFDNPEDALKAVEISNSRIEPSEQAQAQQEETAPEPLDF